MSPDQDLVRAICARQEGSEEEFVGRYRSLAFGLAMGRFACSRDEAEDLFQELIANLWQNDFRSLRAWRGQGKLSTYLTVIISRMCLARRKRALRETPFDDQPEAVASEPRPEAVVTERERATAARAALVKLTSRDRLLLTLRFVDERSPKEIAPLLGLTAGACRKRIHDALGRLRSAMRSENPELFTESRRR